MKNKTFFTWLLIFSVIYFLEVAGSTLIGRGFPLPLWFCLLGWFLLFGLTQAIWPIFRLLSEFHLSETVTVGIRFTILGLCLIILLFKLHAAGATFSALPIILGFITLIGPGLILFASPDSAGPFWIGLPVLFLGLSTNLMKTIYEYWKLTDQTVAPLTALLILVGVFSGLLFWTGRFFTSIEDKIKENLFITTATIMVLVFVSIGAWEFTSDPIQWEFSSEFTGNLPDYSIQGQDREEPRPNIFIISIDTLRFDQLKNSDGQYHFPQFLRDSIKLDQVISTSGWTLPSHASLFTGLLPYQHGAVKSSNEILTKIPTFTQYLNRSGYQTAAYTDGGYLGEDYGFGRGFDEYWEQTPIYYGEYVPGFIELVSWILRDTNFRFLYNPTTRPIQRKHRNYAHKTFSRATDWLKDNTKPFFLFAHTYQAHDYWKQYPAGLKKLRSENKNLHEVVMRHRPTSMTNMESTTPALVKGYKSLYRHEVKRSADQVKTFFKYLRKNNLYENSYVLLLSDHGEGFSLDPKILGHGHGQLDNILIKIPVFLKLPNNKHNGTKIDSMISIKDLFPMVMKQIGFKIKNKTFPEHPSLGGLLSGNEEGRRFTFGSTIHHRQNDNYLPKLFVRSQKRLMTAIPEHEVYNYYEIQSNPPYQSSVDPTSPESVIPRSLRKQMTNFIGQYRSSPDPYNRNHSSLTDGEKNMLKGMGYL